MGETSHERRWVASAPKMTAFQYGRLLTARAHLPHNHQQHHYNKFCKKHSEIQRKPSVASVVANSIPPKESPSFEWTGRDSRHGFGQWMWIMTGGSADGRCCWRSKRSADLTGTRSNSTFPRCGCDGTLTVQDSSNSTSSVTRTASWLTSRLTPWPTSTVT